jgi:isopenicillin-N epimerase
LTTRRNFLRAAGAAGVASAVPLHSSALALAATDDTSIPPLEPREGALQDVARDEAYWRRVASRFQIAKRPVNLEAGYFGVMAMPVLQAYRRHIDRVNQEGSRFARREFPALESTARERLAAFIGGKPTEVAFTRGATEALQSLIGQYRHVGAGDTVMYADLDYRAMQQAMNGLAERQGARVERVDIPQPVSHATILRAYEVALDANPRTRLLLLTHTNNKTGLIHPVREIAEMARSRGADVIVDAAHSFGQMPLTVHDFGADFVGLNLHKWIGAPLGLGAFWIRDSRLDAIGRAHGSDVPPHLIDGRVFTGTLPFPTLMTVPDALDFQATIGMPQKAARLRYLRDRWVSAVRDVPGVDVLTPDEPGMVGALTSFRLHGRGGAADVTAVVDTLLDEFGIFTVQRSGLARGDCVRITPNVFNMPAEVDRLAAALRTLASRG